jgi:hypothetical protein
MFKYFSRLLSLLVCATFLSTVLIPASAQVVEINGWGQCIGDCGSSPMPGMNGGGAGGTGGGSGGWNSSDGYDDGTRGTATIFNRQPGCQKEGY